MAMSFTGRAVARTSRSMPERAEDIAREAFGKMQSVIFWILSGVWTLAWLVVAGMGAALDSPALTEVGLTVLGASAVLWIGARTARRLVLGRRARTSLRARARLERMALNRDADGVLGAFDHSYQRALALLDSPQLSGVADDARRNLGRVRDQIYDVVSTEMRLRREAKSLRRLRAVGAVHSALGEAEEQMRALHQESDRIAQDTQRLADRLDRVRQLAAGPAPAAEANDGLERVLQDLDRTATAYEEIERERLESAEERAERRQRAAASQKLGS